MKALETSAEGNPAATVLVPLELSYLMQNDTSVVILHEKSNKSPIGLIKRKLLVTSPLQPNPMADCNARTDLRDQGQEDIQQSRTTVLGLTKAQQMQELASNYSTLLGPR